MTTKELPTGGAAAATDMPSPLSRPSRRHARVGAFNQRYWAWAMLLPSLLLVGVVVVYPVLQGVLLAFQEYDLTDPDPPRFVGLDNFRRLFEDRIARKALWNTQIYVFGGVAVQMLLGLGSALLLRHDYRGVWLVRLVMMLPWFMPPVVTAHMWRLMLDARIGVIPDALQRIGAIDSPPAWFADPNTALYTVMAVELWRSFPFFTLFILAALLTIPVDIDEAAVVDGASSWAQFRYITLPLIRPVMVVAGVLQAIRLFNMPDLLIVLTGGGPANSTQVGSLYAFQTAYTRFDFGYASTISLALMAVMLGVTLVSLKLTRAGNK